ncbi:MAG: DNA mismatch repair endonuclease MutL [Chloroflexota bacterium]
MAIKRLPSQVAARIAAGEVIDRPSAAVKELVENSIDAGARRIVVEIQNGGVDLIRVSDDGHGIAGADLALAFERHATSKLETEDDLARIATLGFRGEALPSIAAIGDVDCVSCPRGDERAAAVSIRDGRTEGPAPAARAEGTTITVRELFGALPVRRRFLRGRSAEATHVAAAVGGLALAYPGVAISLISDGRRLIGTPGDGDLHSAVSNVLSHDLAAGMAMLEAVERDGVRIEGCVSTGQATLPTRTGITIIVNGRCVQNRALAFAIEECYRTLVTVGRHPVAVLHVTVPAADVDVNVHPRKTEIKLRHERSAFTAVQEAIGKTLHAVHGPRLSQLGEDGALELQGEDERPWVEGIRVLGQAGSTYIIAEGRAGVYLVDQHAAHERVLYEELLEGARRGVAVQPMLEPVVLELGAAEAEAIRERTAAFGELGFEVEPFGDRSLLVRGVPHALVHRKPLLTLRAAIASMIEGTADDWRERIAVSLACHNAVRVGDRLATEEMTALLVQLGEADLCGACSHGRPTAILLSHKQLEREFGRDYR